MEGNGEKMEIKIKGKELVLKHKLKSSETYKISKGNRFETISIFPRPKIMKGFSNVCEDGYAILVIDYDNVDIGVVEQDWLLIQKRFRLPPAYVFKTNKGYHVICLKRMLQTEVFKILQFTRADNNFKDMLVRNPFRSYVLRLSKKDKKKIKYVKLIGYNENNKYKISFAHHQLIHKIYKLPKIYYPNVDGLEGVKLETYETG